jgi:hypothetical protein
MIATTLYAARPRATVLIWSLRVDISATSEKQTYGTTVRIIQYTLMQSDAVKLNPLTVPTVNW